MRLKQLCMVFAAFLLTGQAAVAQDEYPYRALDPKQYDPAVDPQYNMFIGNWQDSMPRLMHGSLVFRDILTGLNGDDPLRPQTKGAVLVYQDAISHVTLEPGSTAKSEKLDGIQQVFYVDEGEGTISSDGKTYDLRNGNVFVVTPHFDFTMTATGDKPLAMYALTEPLPDGYDAKRALEVGDRFKNNMGMNVHWANIDRGIIGGLANYGGMTLVTLDAMTIAQPHSHNEGIEECWIAVKGDIKLLLGKQLFDFPVGSVYKVPANGLTAHANINMTDEPVQLIHMMKSLPGKAKEYAQLDPTQYDPEKDPNIDMFIGDWRQSMPRLMHGSIVFRDILTSLQGQDHLNPSSKGAVLLYADAVSYATLEPGPVAKPGTLDGVQQVYYVNSGTGVITSGSKTVELAEGNSFIISPGLDFELKATGTGNLTMYVVTEKLEKGFKPNNTLVVTSEYDTQPFMKVHWANIDRQVITDKNGMAQYHALTAVKLAPMTMAQPHSHPEGTEEIWIAMKGDIKLQMGKELRVLPVGCAYKIPATGKTAHANINASTNGIKLMHMMKVPGRVW